MMVVPFMQRDSAVYNQDLLSCSIDAPGGIYEYFHCCLQLCVRLLNTKFLCSSPA